MKSNDISSVFLILNVIIFINFDLRYIINMVDGSANVYIRINIA